MKVLLLDSAFSAEPMYEYLIAAGHDVWVMGSRSSDVLAVRASERWVNQDYSKPEEVLKHLKRLNIDAVVPGCTDVSLETCTQIGAPWFLGDTRAVNEALSNKAEFRRLCGELELPAPRAHALTSFPKRGQFICKPVDAFSGRGISVFDGEDASALQAAVASARQASPTSSIVVENFCAGDLYSCSAFVVHGKLTAPHFVREGSSANPYAVDTSCVVFDLDAHVIESLITGLERLSVHLGLSDGLLHTQFILSDGKPYIVEITRRCPGDLYSRLIELSTDFPYAASYASAFLGDIRVGMPMAERHVLRHTVTSFEGGVYGGLFFRTSQTVKAFYPLAQIGASLLPKQGNRAGVIFLDFPNRMEMLKSFESFLARDAYRVS